MDKSRKYIAIAFVVVLAAVVIVSVVGILTLRKKPDILQGQIVDVLHQGHHREQGLGRVVVIPVARLLGIARLPLVFGA